MKTVTLLAASLGALLMVVNPGFATTETNTTLQLILNLDDGSRVICECNLQNLPVVSESLGQLSIPTANIVAVKFAEDHKTATITLRNGDAMQGAVAQSAFQVKTAFGNVSVPTKLIRTFQVSGGVKPDAKPVDFRAYRGTWRIQYSNGFTRVYEIGEDGQVSFSDENASGKLAMKNNDVVLDFGDGKLERLQVDKDRKELKVDHFNPASQYPDTPTHTGAGVRVTASPAEIVPEQPN